MKSARESSFSNITPISTSEIKLIEDALTEYNNDCKICVNQGANDYKCHQAAEKKLIRAMPFMRKNIYPYANYDWDYSNYIDNNYSVNATGATKTGSISAIFKNIGAFIKLAKGYLVDPNPADSSYAGKYARDGDIAYYECIGSAIDAGTGKPINDPRLKAACRARHKVKYRTAQKAPTSDSFLKKHKITGDGSSSYYVKIGTCPRPDIKNRNKCEKNGFDWIPNPLDAVMSKMPKILRTETSSGSCHQPRYAYLDNKPGFTIAGLKARGLIPALANDFLSLSPDKLLAALQGQSVSGLYSIQPCPIVKESFQNYKNKTDNLIRTTIIILVIFAIIILVKLSIYYNK